MPDALDSLYSEGAPFNAPELASLKARVQTESPRVNRSVHPFYPRMKGREVGTNEKGPDIPLPTINRAARLSSAVGPLGTVGSQSRSAGVLRAGGGSTRGIAGLHGIQSGSHLTLSVRASLCRGTSYGGKPRE